jgi:hypothetical protein
MSTTDKLRGFATLAGAMRELARRREAEARKQAQGKPAAQDRRERRGLNLSLPVIS